MRPATAGTWILLLTVTSFCEQSQAANEHLHIMASPPETTLTKDTALGHVPLDAHNYPVAPEGLSLEQVHLFVRHGA